MRQETFTLSQKELQRVSVITACVKGDMACASAACAWLAKANSCNSTAAARLARRPRSAPHLLGMQDDAAGKSSPLSSSLGSAEGYFHVLQSLLHRFGVPTAFYGDRSGIFVRNEFPLVAP